MSTSTREEKRAIRGSSSEIYYLEDGKRHWVPDPLTFTTLGLKWDDVELVPDEQLQDIPEGPPMPTAVPPRSYEDGSFVSADGETVYVAEQGKLRLVPDLATFVELGGREPKRTVQTISAAELRAQPIGEALVSRVRTLEVDIYTFLGAGHQMWTKAGLLTSAGLLQANTRTRTYTWFGGYTGGVEVTINDRDGYVIWKSSTHRFGVDGTAIGRSDRTDYWEERPPAEVLDQAASLAVAHFWSPDWMRNLDRWLAVGKQIAAAIGEIKKLAGGAGGGVGPLNPP
jgi:hypothetical protein